uniref:Uncharacterized protein n=1 Tax=Peronospora matthiolae TaxID=2874970 RepID=A0AAV1UQ89_9STRA
MRGDCEAVRRIFWYCHYAQALWGNEWYRKTEMGYVSTNEALSGCLC